MPNFPGTTSDSSLAVNDGSLPATPRLSPSASSEQAGANQALHPKRVARRTSVTSGQPLPALSAIDGLPPASA